MTFSSKPDGNTYIRMIRRPGHLLREILTVVEPGRLWTLDLAFLQPFILDKFITVDRHMHCFTDQNITMVYPGSSAILLTQVDHRSRGEKCFIWIYVLSCMLMAQFSVIEGTLNQNYFKSNRHGFSEHIFVSDVLQHWMPQMKRLLIIFHTYMHINSIIDRSVHMDRNQSKFAVSGLKTILVFCNKLESDRRYKFISPDKMPI